MLKDNITTNITAKIFVVEYVYIIFLYVYVHIYMCMYFEWPWLTYVILDCRHVIVKYFSGHYVSLSLAFCVAFIARSNFLLVL